MLLTRDEIRRDKSFDLLTEAILERDQPRTTDLFFRMVTRDGRSTSDALSVVTAAEAPSSRCPATSTCGRADHPHQQRPHHPRSPDLHEPGPLPARDARLLPLLQSVWYIPAGLDIWNQLLAGTRALSRR